MEFLFPFPFSYFGNLGNETDFFHFQNCQEFFETKKGNGISFSISKMSFLIFGIVNDFPDFSNCPEFL